MKLLPFKNTDAIQLNPYLGIILTADMHGWFFEHFINLFMIGSIIDYTDNVNYSGIINHQRTYSFKETQKNGTIRIIEREIDNNNYLRVWVDEIHIPCSSKYKSYHYVHPLLVIGYDSNKKIVKTVIFDNHKGQVVIDIRYKDIVKATKSLSKYYSLGGSDNTLNETVSAFSLSYYLKGDFHLNYFAQQLDNYISCKTDEGWEWYTSCREGVFESKEKIYGIQIYLHLNKYISSGDLITSIKYKTLHDFILHKKGLLERFVFIKENYDTPPEYENFVDDYNNLYTALEKIRLLGMKNQMRNGLSVKSLCLDVDYIEKLSQTLLDCYKVEMELLPRILDIIKSLSYSKDFLANNSFKSVALISDNMCDNKYVICDEEQFIYRVDIIRAENSNHRNTFEYICLNNDVKYYLSGTSVYSPIRSIIFPPIKLRSLQLYTQKPNVNYIANIFPLPNQYNIDLDAITLNNSWHSYHHIEQINEGELNFLITDEDPFIVKDNIGVNADAYKYLHIEMCTTAKTIYAQVYFSTTDNPDITMDKSLFFKINPDGIFHSYYIKMSANNKWQGFVKSIRIDPAQYHDNYGWDSKRLDTCTISLVEFIKNIPDGVAECMTATDLEDDGSTFTS